MRSAGHAPCGIFGTISISSVFCIKAKIIDLKKEMKECCKTGNEEAPSKLKKAASRIV